MLICFNILFVWHLFYFPSIFHGSTFSMSVLTSVSGAELDIVEALVSLFSEDTWVGESTAGKWNKYLKLDLRNSGEPSLGTGDAEGVILGDGRGERFPISMAWSSVQARPWLRRKSSVSLSTTSSLVRWGDSQIRFTTCRQEKQRRNKKIDLINTETCYTCHGHGDD